MNTATTRASQPRKRRKQASRPNTTATIATYQRKRRQQVSNRRLKFAAVAALLLLISLTTIVAMTVGPTEIENTVTGATPEAQPTTAPPNLFRQTESLNQPTSPELTPAQRPTRVSVITPFGGSNKFMDQPRFSGYQGISKDTFLPLYEASLDYETGIVHPWYSQNIVTSSDQPSQITPFGKLEWNDTLLDALRKVQVLKDTKEIALYALEGRVDPSKGRMSAFVGTDMELLCRIKGGDSNLPIHDESDLQDLFKQVSPAVHRSLVFDDLIATSLVRITVQPIVIGDTEYRMELRFGQNEGLLFDNRERAQLQAQQAYGSDAEFCWPLYLKRVHLTRHSRAQTKSERAQERLAAAKSYQLVIDTIRNKYPTIEPGKDGMVSKGSTSTNSMLNNIMKGNVWRWQDGYACILISNREIVYRSDIGKYLDARCKPIRREVRLSDSLHKEAQRKKSLGKDLSKDL